MHVASRTETLNYIESESGKFIKTTSRERSF